VARFRDESIMTNALSAQLQPGEQLYYYAYGVKQPNIFLIILLMCLAILPGAIAVALLTKEYVIGMTERRLIVLRFSGKMKIKEVTDYWLDRLPRVVQSTGSLFTHIKIEDPQKPFVAKFHRLGAKQNRDMSMAMAKHLEDRSRQAQPAMAHAS